MSICGAEYLHYAGQELGQCLVGPHVFSPTCKVPQHASGLGVQSRAKPTTSEVGARMQAADVYAFGVLLWEMVSGQRAWDGLTPAQVMLAVALQKRALVYPSNALPELARHDKPSQHPASQLASALLPECAHALSGSGGRLSSLCGASTNQKTSGSSQVRGRANHLVKKQNVGF